MAACPPNHPTRRNLDRKRDLAAAPGFVKPGSKTSPPRARGGGGVKGWFARGRQGGVLAYLGLQGEPLYYIEAMLTLAPRTMTPLLQLTLAILIHAMRP